MQSLNDPSQVQTWSNSVRNPRTGTLLLALIWPAVAHAEPAASMGHLPFLWLLAIGLAAYITRVSLAAIGRRRRWQQPVWKWVIAAILFAVVLIFISPFIVGLGSILITGRTM